MTDFLFFWIKHLNWTNICELILKCSSPETLNVLLLCKESLSQSHHQYRTLQFCGQAMMIQLMHDLVTVAAASGDDSLKKHWSLFPGLINSPSVVVLKQQDKGLVAINEIHFRTYCLQIIQKTLLTINCFSKIKFQQFSYLLYRRKIKNIKLLVTGMCQEWLCRTKAYTTIPVLSRAALCWDHIHLESFRFFNSILFLVINVVILILTLVIGAEWCRHWGQKLAGKISQLKTSSRV